MPARTSDDDTNDDADDDRGMNWETLRSVLILHLSTSRPHLKQDIDIDEEVDGENVDYLITSLQEEGVALVPKDGELTLSEPEAHPFRNVLSPLLEELFGIQNGEVTFFCSCVIDAYLFSTRSVQADEASPTQRKPATCELCARPMPLTAHHLYPRSEHSKLLKRTQLSKAQLQQTLAFLCRPCHSAVHKMLDAPTLAREYASVERLIAHEGLARWAAWAGKQRVVGKGLRTAR
ncbi:hypothetical protein DACRYDRAFT_117778 [Dacryopinax primogenitus]|uniref:HNH domain-containing protein n=1 Tax=Dacryopinax primogenitus (strain DJM 731) TaxID=1858805 RepID=M5FR63_DACPD|nr:uncharacterized protein DACRYDRAFT_117778 [Dacryopinax primogenitus]EJT99565.1 hypothetical protein DACRYDRAFT_117778 [Dacryopinax primogenitus]